MLTNSLNRKIAVPLTAALLSFSLSDLANATIPRNWECSTRVEEGKARFTITHGKDNYHVKLIEYEAGKVKAWYVIDSSTKETIGDDQPERETYSKVSLAATVGHFKQCNPGFEEDLRAQAKEFRKRAGQKTVVDVSSFIVQQGSKLEGILASLYLSGGSSNVISISGKIAEKEIVDQAVQQIKDDLKKEFVSEDAELGSAKGYVEFAQKIRDRFLQSTTAQILKAASALNEAAITYESIGPVLDTETAESFYRNWKYGHCRGEAILILWGSLSDDAKWGSIARKVMKHFGESATGVSLDKTVDFIFNTSEVQDSFTSLEDLVARKQAPFEGLETYFYLGNGTNATALLTELRNQPRVADDSPLFVFNSYVGAINSDNHLGILGNLAASKRSIMATQLYNFDGVSCEVLTRPTEVIFGNEAYVTTKIEISFPDQSYETHRVKCKLILEGKEWKIDSFESEQIAE